MLSITSLQNQKVKEAIQLRDRRGREASSLFLIEGYRELKRAVEAGVKIERLFTCPDFFLGSNEFSLIELAGGEQFECSKEVFQKLSYRDRPDGLLAVAQCLKTSLRDLEPGLKKTKAPFLVVAESIEKPGNLGTILRSADGAGVDAVIVADPTTDIHNPNVVRSSVGTLFTLPVVQASAEETLRFLKEQNILIAAATPHAALEYTQVDLTRPVAVVVGTEQYGLSPLWMKEAEIQMKIPMLGVADSLNVASATTLVLYEVVRQRRA